MMKHSTIGLVISFVLTLSAGNVATAAFLQAWDPFFMLLVVFGSTGVLFTLAHLKTRPALLLDVVKGNYRLILALNATTAGAWVTTYMALRTLEPAIALAVTFSIAPFAVMCMSPRAVTRRDIACATGILTVVAYFVVTTLSGLTAVGHADPIRLIGGFGAAVASSLAVAGNTVVSKALGTVGVPASAVVATRFHLLTGIALVLWLTGGGALHGHGVWGWTQLVLLGLLGNALPLFLLQRIIERTAAITVSFVVMLPPIATFVLQFLDPRLQQSGHSLFGIFVVTSLVLLALRRDEAHVARAPRISESRFPRDLRRPTPAAYQGTR